MKTFVEPPARRREQEVKYVLSNHQSQAVLHYLQQRFRPDPEFPDGIISSVYFDTPRLHHLAEKRNSDYLKTKIRMRWYADTVSAEPLDDAFLEAKFRIGAARTKERIPCSGEGPRFARLPLTHPDWPRRLEPLRQRHIVLTDRYLPVLQISYRRHRFIEPSTGIRLCLDRNISVPRVNPMLMPHFSGFMLEASVMETKGNERECPPALRRVIGLGARKQAFSKYETCYRKAMVYAGYSPAH